MRKKEFLKGFYRALGYMTAAGLPIVILAIISLLTKGSFSITL